MVDVADGVVGSEGSGGAGAFRFGGGGLGCAEPLLQLGLDALALRELGGESSRGGMEFAQAASLVDPDRAAEEQEDGGPK
jgi:hypothetical protein